METTTKDKVPYLLEEAPRFSIPNTTKKNWVIQGYSKAGERTGFWLEPLNIVLDAGVVTNKTPNAVFISHSHVDHSWNLPWIFGCRTAPLKGFEHLQGRPVFAPSSAWPMVKQLEQACHNLSVGFMEFDTNSGDQILKEQRAVPYQVKSGAVLENLPGLAGITVHTLPCYHTTETVGYGFSTSTQKLKPEYQSLTPKEISSLRSKQPDLVITQSFTSPQLVFFGDTSVKALLLHEEWKQYPVIIIECTIYPAQKKTAAEVEEIGHVHWDGIFPIIQANQKNFFVLIHSSVGMSKKDLEDFEVKIKKDSNVNNFKIWT